MIVKSRHRRLPIKTKTFVNADGAKMFMYGKNIGEWLDLKAVSFNNASYLVAINNQYSATLTEEIKEANWKFTLPDGTAIKYVLINSRRFRP